jgi:hypothetical protein
VRKLAREAVIFMLLTPLLVVAGTFIYFHATIPNKVVLDMSTSRPLNEVEKANAPPGATRVVRAFPPSQACLNFDSNGDCSNRAFLVASLFFGLYGFPAGLGLWIFYRLIRFAIKG